MTESWLVFTHFSDWKKVGCYFELNYVYLVSYITNVGSYFIFKNLDLKLRKWKRFTTLEKYSLINTIFCVHLNLKKWEKLSTRREKLGWDSPRQYISVYIFLPHELIFYTLCTGYHWVFSIYTLFIKISSYYIPFYSTALYSTRPIR